MHSAAAAAVVVPPFVVSVVVAAVATFAAVAALLFEAFECRQTVAVGPNSEAFHVAGPSEVSEWEEEVRGWPGIGASPWGSSG